MRSLLLGCFATLLLFGCESHQPKSMVSEQPTVPQAAEAPRQPTIASATVDSVGTPVFSNVYCGQMWFGPKDASRAIPHLTLDGQLWQVHTAAQADSAHPLTFVVPADKENHQPATVEKGAEVQYTFQLLDQHGRPRFTRQLHKADFANIVYGGLRTVAVVAPPTFLGYWPARRALVFEVGFGREDTDDGLEVLVLLNATTGQVQHLAAEKAFMGSCDCWPTLAHDGQTLLAGEELLLANGQVIPLSRNDRALAGTGIINDSTFLVVYESGAMSGSRVLSHNNAQLVGRKGHIQRTFTFHGTDSNWASGGYSLALAFLPATGTNYLFDGRTTTFTLIPASRPSELQQLGAGQIIRFYPPQRASEKKLEFEYNDMPTAALYVDTVTQKLRYADTRITY